MHWLLKLRGWQAAAFAGGAVLGIAVLLAARIDYEDIHEHHGTIATSPFTGLGPGMIYEVGERPGGSPICVLDGNVDGGPVSRVHNRYYNVLGRALARFVNAASERLVGGPLELAIEIEVAFERRALPPVFLRPPSDDCLATLAQAVVTHGSRICVVDHVLVRPGESVPFAVRFKEHTIMPAGIDAAPCPLAYRPVKLASLRRVLIDVEPGPADARSAETFAPPAPRG